MESEQERAQDLSQLIKRLIDEYQVTGSEVARRVGVTPQTVNAWIHRTRGTGRGPKRETLQAIAREFPKFSEAEVFAAAGRKRPGPLGPDASQRILELYAGLTKEQQEITETQMRALNEANRNL